jgi:hypothetical protein
MADKSKNPVASETTIIALVTLFFKSFLFAVLLYINVYFFIKQYCDMLSKKSVLINKYQTGMIMKRLEDEDRLQWKTIGSKLVLNRGA